MQKVPKPAPICLFVFNRPDHTRLTLEFLAKNKLAESSILYVFCDGPKENTTTREIDAINQVRDIIANENRFLSIKIIYAETNIGLGNSIINGISSVLGSHEYVIVLEDDHLAHPDFLVFMNYYLYAYKNNKRVMHIAGFQRNSWLQFFLPRIYFTRHMDCGGWATWADRWKLLITDIKMIDGYLSIDYNRDRMNFRILERHKQLDLNRNGLRTWAIFWSSTILIHNGLSIRSRFSYIKNIGNDGSGSNNIVKRGLEGQNYVDSFKPKLKDPVEIFLGEWYIMDAYSKRSQKRLNSIKDLIFKILTNFRSKIIASPFEMTEKYQ